MGCNQPKYLSFYEWEGVGANVLKPADLYPLCSCLDGSKTAKTQRIDFGFKPYVYIYIYIACQLSPCRMQFCHDSLYHKRTIT